MDVRSLGYIGIDVADVDGWRTYAELLGTMVIADGAGLRMRIDERPFRVAVHAGVEALTLDDVGYALDRHHDTETPISMEIGKHSNDQMVSFYSQSPSVFEVEFGCGGLLTDEADWTVSQIT